MTAPHRLAIPCHAPVHVRAKEYAVRPQPVAAAIQAFISLQLRKHATALQMASTNDNTSQPQKSSKPIPAWSWREKKERNLADQTDNVCCGYTVYKFYYRVLYCVTFSAIVMKHAVFTVVFLTQLQLYNCNFILFSNIREETHSSPDCCTNQAD